MLSCMPKSNEEGFIAAQQPAPTIWFKHVSQGLHLLLLPKDLKRQRGLADIQDVAAEDGSQVPQLTTLRHATLDLQQNE